jgi:hypothetical protein
LGRLIGAEGAAHEPAQPIKRPFAPSKVWLTKLLPHDLREDHRRRLAGVQLQQRRRVHVRQAHDVARQHLLRQALRELSELDAATEEQQERGHVWPQCSRVGRHILPIRHAQAACAQAQPLRDRFDLVVHLLLAPARIDEAEFADAHRRERAQRVPDLRLARREDGEHLALAVVARVGEPWRNVRDLELHLLRARDARRSEPPTDGTEQGHLRRVALHLRQCIAQRCRAAVGLDRDELRRPAAGLLDLGERETHTGRVVAREFLLVGRAVEQLRHAQGLRVGAARLGEDGEGGKCSTGCDEQGAAGDRSGVFRHGGAA